MSLRIVRLGSPRAPDEGTRIGTVRRPPRGVPKSEFARQNWYDVWFPVLAPSAETMKLGQAAETPAQWAAFTRRYRKDNGVPIPGTTAVGIGALAVGNIKYKTEAGLFDMIIESDKPLYLDFRDAYALAQKLAA